MSSRILCSRSASRERSSICALRYRVRFRSVRIGLGGTKLAFNSPASSSWHSHCASLTSVLRPGTALTWRALTSSSSKSSSRIAQTGFQYTPVASIATCVTPSAFSQSRSANRPCTVVCELRDVLGQLALLPHPHAGRHRRLVHVQRARALNDPLHHEPPSIRSTMIAVRGAPRYQTMLKRVLKATVRGSGKAPTPDLTTGSQAPRKSRRRRTAPRSSPTMRPPGQSRNPDFIPPQVAKPRHDDVSADFRAARSTLLFRVFEVEAPAAPPGHGGVGEVG